MLAAGGTGISSSLRLNEGHKTGPRGKQMMGAGEGCGGEVPYREHSPGARKGGRKFDFRHQL